jgi:hypothetical protein
MIVGQGLSLPVFHHLGPGQGQALPLQISDET